MAEYRVRAVSPSGDVRFDRSYAFDPIPVAKNVADDEIADRNLTRDGATGLPEVTAAETFAPVRRVVAGSDGTVWIEQEERRPEHTWLVLDPHGQPSAKLVLGEQVWLAVAQRNRVWAFENDENDLKGIVRYSLASTSSVQ